MIMELRATREMRRNEQLSRTMAKKADTACAPDREPAEQIQTPAPLSDKVSLSRQALAYIEDQRGRLMQELEERRARQESRLADCQNKKNELDILSMELKVLEACQKIAASIMKGDKVPLKDLKFLMENDPAGYKLAMAMRREKKDPEEVESVLDEEQPPASAEGTENGGESPVAAVAPPPVGGAASGGRE